MILMKTTCNGQTGHNSLYENIFKMNMKYMKTTWDGQTDQAAECCERDESSGRCENYDN